MKTILSIVIALTSINAFAAMDCETKVSKTAIKDAYPRGVPASLSVDAAVKLVKARNGIRKYEVDVYTSSSDGASSFEFPAEMYTITASGTKEACKVVLIEKFNY